MRRREFITLFGGAAVASTWPFAASPQKAPMPVVGLLIGGWPQPFAPALVGFREGLKEVGFLEGKEAVIEPRFAQGQFDRLPQLAADLVGRQVSAIVTATLPGALAAKAATTTIPIVFVVGEDPVQVGLVASLNRPGGNVTGVSGFANVLAAKRLELVAETVPQATVLGLLVNPNNPNADPDTRALQTAVRGLGRELQVLPARTEGDLETVFDIITQERIGAILVNIDSFFASRANQLVALAAQHGVPVICPLRSYVAAGGLMSYDANYTNSFRQAGLYTGRILKGANPADLPVMQPTKLELVINLRTAKALGLSMPPTLLARADEVIE
jgi:putative ABC transport system substrate-binding protein